jgi:excisionase family DNA binding protein
MPATDTPQTTTVNPRQVADVLGVHLNTVYTLLDEEKLRSFRVGRMRRVRLADLEEFMASGGTR